MTLERAIAGIFIAVCLAYGYTAFVVMEADLLPFERNMTFLPNILPKWLSVLGAVAGFFVLVRSKPAADAELDPGGIDVRRLRQYKLGQAIFLLALLVGGIILGERRYVVLVLVSVLAAFVVWYLVQEVLGIFLRPWPAFV